MTIFTSVSLQHALAVCATLERYLGLENVADNKLADAIVRSGVAVTDDGEMMKYRQVLARVRVERALRQEGEQ
jgi:hypothetical protein